MFLIIDKSDNSIHREPKRARDTYTRATYKTASAAKAGITRTVKYYQKAIDQVADCLVNGEPAYMARMHTVYRYATEAHFNKVHKQFATSYEIVNVEDYAEPIVTRTGVAPGTGKEITISLPQSKVGTSIDPLTETYWCM